MIILTIITFIDTMVYILLLQVSTIFEERYMFKFNKIRLGFRTIKTGISVFLCILLFGLLDRGSPIIAALSAVFAMREDVGTSVKFGWQRILGNIIGAFFSIIVIAIVQWTSQIFWTQLITVPLFIMLIIVICDATDNNTAIIAGCATFLAILFVAPDQKTLEFAFGRVIDTFIGAGISLLVNHFIKRPDSNNSSLTS